MNSMFAGGDEFAGYRIDTLIGRGGMSEVYRAENPRLGNKVALKLLAPQLAEDELFRERFVRESRLAAALDHPNVLPVYDAGEADGRPYIAMRYVDGFDLTQLIEQGPLPLERVVGIVAQVGGALDCAHGRGLLHRDVKPANILIDDTGDGDHAYLADFGVAKHSHSSSGLTGTGQFVGTIDYISPEQIEGKPLDGRTDVYSLGCVTYEALTGASPFERDSNVAMIYAHLLDPAPSLLEKRPDLPAALDAVVAKALAKSPDDRYSTCRAFAADLRAVAAPSVVTAPNGSETILAAGAVGLDAAATTAAPTATLLAPTAAATTPAAAPSVTVPAPTVQASGAAPPPAATPPLRSGTPPQPQQAFGVAAFEPAEPPRAADWWRSRRLLAGAAVVALALAGAAAAAKTLTGGSGANAPAAPKALHVRPEGSTVKLSWTKPASAGVDGYRVMRNGRQIATTRGTSYVDRDLSLSARYVYAVRAFHGRDVGSTSNRATVRTSLSGIVISVNESPVSPHQGLQKSAKPGSKPTVPKSGPANSGLKPGSSSSQCPGGRCPVSPSPSPSSSCPGGRCPVSPPPPPASQCPGGRCPVAPPPPPPPSVCPAGRCPGG